MLLHHLGVDELRGIVAAGQAAGEHQAHRRDAAVDGAPERVLVHRDRHLRGRRLGAVAHRLEEVMGGRRLVQVVGVLAVFHDVGEVDQLNTFAVDHLEGQIAARIDDEVARTGHSVS